MGTPIHKQIKLSKKIYLANEKKMDIKHILNLLVVLYLLCFVLDLIFVLL